MGAGPRAATYRASRATSWSDSGAGGDARLPPRGVEALTLYSFSTENWRRPGEEVDALMALLVRYLAEERDEIMDNEIRLTASGELSRLPKPVQQRWSS